MQALGSGHQLRRLGRIAQGRQVSGYGLRCRFKALEQRFEQLRIADYESPVQQLHRVVHVYLEIGQAPIAGQFVLGNVLLSGYRFGIQVPVAGHGEEILVVDGGSQHPLQSFMQDRNFLLQPAGLIGDQKPLLHRPVQLLDVGQQGGGPVAHALNDRIAAGLRLKRVNPGFEYLPVRSHRGSHVFQFLKRSRRRKPRGRGHQRPALLGYRKGAGNLGKAAIDHAPLGVGDRVEGEPAVDAREHEQQQRRADPHVHADRNLVPFLKNLRNARLERAVAVVPPGIHHRAADVSIGRYSPSGLTTVR